MGQSRDTYTVCFRVSLASSYSEGPGIPSHIWWFIQREMRPSFQTHSVHGWAVLVASAVILCLGNEGSAIPALLG